MLIRNAKAGDAERIAEIWNAEIRNGVSTFNSVEKSIPEIEDQIQSRGAAFQVADHAGAVIGFATYFPFRNGIGYAFSKEHTIDLSPEARGTGAGRALMEALLSVAKAEGVHSMMAGIAGENTAGVRFHAALGFNEVARLPEVGYKFNRRMDLILMQKFL
ncbi:GNAT family N-acetyltransferase [Cognatishimia maritima]|uniref:Phosphinothricin acetyltransferase n=1 Tax=Cognatishimia maritima TaxID=870908 RepID=A0A1M5JR86_9RHOB|nr:GNAT family N-acetyltransferase [Cognatishimia maritima]SHG43096.1 phosphinothricin acetyltransferase [Cognatishimia maritima]